MRTEAHEALTRVLDDAPEAQVSEGVNGEVVDPQVFYGEHAARLRAEAEAQDKAARLRVAQEQLAEYAAEKSVSATAVLTQAQQLEELLRQVHAASRGGSGDAAGAVAAALHQLERLTGSLSEAAEEAQAFAEQQRADVERLKRSSQQAQLLADDGDVDMKRPREESDATGASSSDGGGDGDGGEAVGAASGSDAGVAAAAQRRGRVGVSSGNSSSSEEEEDEVDEGSDDEEGGNSGAATRGGRAMLRLLGSGAAANSGRGGPAAASSSGSARERARYIPLRLKMEERRLLRLLEAALNVSEYTDKVDILTWRSKHGRVHAQIRDLCAILTGLLVAQDYKAGQQLVVDKEFRHNAQLFQDVFEIGRRYKVMNPDKMRSEYGKLVYMLMDSADAAIQELLEFKCVRPLLTVSSFLEGGGAGALLDDPLLGAATAEIVSRGRSRPEVQRDIRSKERAREVLARKYRRPGLSEEDILWAIYSISDHSSYLLFNRDPLDRLIQYFTAYFRPDVIAPGYSLAISGGRGGARLTHSHERQYHYVLQSLTLWREISDEMFRLWWLADQDLLREGGSYRLCDTGQGLNRVQQCPGVAKAMQQILARCQARIGHWVGSSVVHLGDHNVPNALMFIDKYTQVPRITTPLVGVLDALPGLTKDPQIAKYLDASFGGVEACRMAILCDFCRHGFDGSGADSFFDAGSCIDGRLTSAWHWCNQLDKKPYFPVFKLAGFNGFDGDFK